MTARLMEGSEAIAEAMVAAGCRFFTGYPMTPFTEVLETMGRLLPDVGGVCMNAESELEAVGMAWGACAAGVRAATGSVGQGLSLMQESLSEASTARLPLVVLNMARGQGDYFQSTRGGGHGDYRHIVVAPCDIPEAVELVQRAFHLADTWRNPVLFLGDYYLAHVQQTVSIEPIDFGPVPPKTWALDGSTSGTGQARVVSFLGASKRGDPERVSLGQYLADQGDHVRSMADEIEPMAESGYLDDAELVVVAYGTPGRYVRYVVRQLRDEGVRVGFIRPITLWPFPRDAVARVAAAGAALAVYELNNGQMVDDVRLAAGGAPVSFIGGVSLDDASFGIAPDLSVRVISDRIRSAMPSQEGNR